MDATDPCSSERGGGVRTSGRVDGWLSDGVLREAEDSSAGCRPLRSRLDPDSPFDQYPDAAGGPSADWPGHCSGYVASYRLHHRSRAAGAQGIDDILRPDSRLLRHGAVLRERGLPPLEAGGVARHHLRRGAYPSSSAVHPGVACVARVQGANRGGEEVCAMVSQLCVFSTRYLSQPIL